MRKTVVRSLLLAIVGVFAMNLRAETAWTTSSCAPNTWTVLSNNLLAGETGTISGAIATGYSTNDPDLLTDISVPKASGKEYRVGFQNAASITWTFSAPKTIECVRVSCGYLDSVGYSGFTVSSIEVQTFGSSDWTALNTTAGQMADTRQGEILSLALADGSGGAIAATVGALRVTFGAPPVGFANYCVEIEAVGSAEATGPVLSSFDITPAKTKAKVSGLIADVGTDATECDVYLSIDNAEAVKIAEGVTDSFEYQVQGLMAGTTYAYELSVSNNAPTAKGTVRSGDFATLAADAQTALWTQGEYAPADWTALGNNILSGLDATEKSGVSYAASQDMTKLTNGSVPDPAAGGETVGFGNAGTIAWAFAKPMTIEKIRLSSLWESTLYNGISVNAIQVKYPDSANWETLDVPTVQWTGGTKLGQMETLSDVETGVLAQNVIGLKITFGAQKAALANYYAEIEAIGFSEATGPVLGALNIAPAKTRATISGSLADVGTDATACDVYLSLDGGAATKIAEGVMGSFEYALKNLTAGTTYAYEFSISNNAPTAKGTVRSGSFTTLAADAQTASWLQGEYAPADWTALENNILSGLAATEKSGLSGYASQDMAKLTDGIVPNPVAGAETVGFTPNGTIAWAFEEPMSIRNIRISSLWESTLYNGISVNAIQVKHPDSTSWEALDVPTVQWTGGTKLGQTETLSDAETGYLARNVVGLKITFGVQKAAVANYYAEIEAVGRLEPKPGFVLVVR
ncbi:MAG: hypothetical protein II840_10635 [Kiritimatiellae bacterium]|nr:hypothetical protein [Kiritimatiellia bacterium]